MSELLLVAQNPASWMMPEQDARVEAVADAALGLSLRYLVGFAVRPALVAESGTRSHPRISGSAVSPIA